MLTMLGSPRQCCDGVTRRETLTAGALTAMGGFGLSEYLSAKESNGPAASAGEGPAKNVIMIFLLGGAATQDMFDLKPEGPKESRGEFKPIATSASGVEICEHLPLLAKWMHRCAIVRSLGHKAGCHNTLPVYSGLEKMLPNITSTKAFYPPSMGSVCEYLDYQARGGTGVGVRSGNLPSYVYMPSYLGWGQAIRRPGPYGGFLGKQFDALTSECIPTMAKGSPKPKPGYPQRVLGQPLLPTSVLQQGLSIDRLNARRGLLDQIDDQLRRFEANRPIQAFGRNQQRAFDILTTSRLREAFDLDRESPEMLDRYGRHLFGHTTLIARRLIEEGVRFVNVTWDLFWDRAKIDYDAWDTHNNNFKILRENKLPGFDQTFSALMEDLDGRGLLDETLIVVVSEMGRTPKINSRAGRDHWTYCYSALLAGAGIRGGTIHGASDAQAAFPAAHPVSTSDICATIYDRLGIDPDLRVPDHLGRPVEIAHGGRPIREILV